MSLLGLISDILISAPAHIVVYSEYTHILFKSSITFTQPDKWPTNSLSKECNEPEGPDQLKAQCMTYELLQNRAVRLHSVLNTVTHGYTGLDFSSVDSLDNSNTTRRKKRQAELAGVENCLCWI